MGYPSKNSHTHINASPPPDTSGMCGTYSVVESDTGTTTLFSADPLCIPDKSGGKKRLQLYFYCTET